MTEIGSGATGYTVRDLNTGASVTLSWAAVSDVGHHRQNNEDSFVVAPPVFAVADGMGGHSAGDVASDSVVRGLSTLSGNGFTTTDAINSALRGAVDLLAASLGETQQGAGTTVTGAALTCDQDSVRWAVFNIGDSRVYLYYGDKLMQLTTDDSVVQQLVDAGQITREEAHTHPHSNVITRAVGIDDEPIPTYSLFDARPGMRFLLCSDGLNKEIIDEGIEHYLKTSPTPQEAVDNLLREALTNSGRDNITIVVVDVHGVTQPMFTGEPSSEDTATGGYVSV